MTPTNKQVEECSTSLKFVREVLSIKKDGRNKIRSLIRLIPMEFSLTLVAGPTEGKLSRLVSSRLVLVTIKFSHLSI